MLRHFLKSRFIRQLVYVLCPLLVLSGPPLLALEGSVRLVPRQGRPAWLEPWLQADTWQHGWESAVGLAADVSRELTTILLASASAQGTPPMPTTPPRSAARPRSDVEAPPVPSEKAVAGGVPFLPGWNIVSLPAAPVDPSPVAVLGDAVASIEGLWVWDCATQAWKTWVPGDAASTLTALDITQGVWLKGRAAGAIPSPGSAPAVTEIPLCPGWNQIGFPSVGPRHPRAALASIEGKYRRVFGYEPSDPRSPWRGFDVDAPEWGNDLSAMQPGRGYWVLATEATTLTLANEGADLELGFVQPADLTVVTEPTDVLATVAGHLLESWTLSQRQIGQDDWTVVATGTTPRQGEKLATFDPTLLLNDLYELKLEAVDVNDLVYEDSIAVSVEGNMKIGHFTLSFVDLAIPLSGLDLEIVRTYDSRQKDLEGDFGQGWTLGIRQGSYRNNRPPGDGWRIPATEGPWGLPCSAVQETKSHLTTVRLSDQEIYRFRLAIESPAAVIGGCFAAAAFEWVDGPLPGTTLEILGPTQVFAANGSDTVVVPDTQEPFVPEDVKLKTRDGRTFHLDLTTGVTHVEDLNGNSLDITAAGVTHSSGVGIDFVRDGEGRIREIVDPRGNANVYTYDLAGDLIQHSDRAGEETRFAYRDHYLEDFHNALGVRAVRTEYDEDGRMVKVIDALGHELKFDHHLGDRREVVINRLGFVRTLEYDARGNVVRETDELSNVTRRSYDAKDRVLTETDPLDHTTTNVYDDAGDLTSVSDPLGNTTRLTYDGRGNPLTVTDPRGKVTRFAYDPSGNGNLTSTTDPLGVVTAFSYDTRGQMLSETDALGNVTSFAYDARGNQVRTTDALGTDTTFAYDAAGNLTSQTTSRTLADGTIQPLVTTFEVDEMGRVTATTLPDDSTSRTTYDALGAVLSTTDPLGHSTSFTYDAAGRQTEILYPDGTAESSVFDAEGRMVAAIDRGGRVTAFAYDAAGRPITTERPDGTRSISTWDNAGRLVGSTDERGFTTSYVYDTAGRQTKVIDALGNATTVAYDASARQTASTDALGHTTSFTFDEAGRLVTTMLPDGETVASEYDMLGRRIAEVNQAGVRTEFGYDTLGRLLQVVDALGGITRYQYDEQGNRISQTDANGHTTRFTYDELGRQTSRILPDGAIESLAYDAAGNIAHRTDFNGATTTYSYDVNGHLVQRSYPDGNTVSFTYTLTGNRSTITDSRGVSTYGYDNRDRLVSISAPEGWTLRYAWDAAGARTAVTADLGDQGVHTTAFTYDSVGSMARVTDPRGGIYTYEYDPAGRLSALSYPNGIVTDYHYDSLGRLLQLHSEAADGSVIQDYTYTLDSTGNRLSATEDDGTVRNWEYDRLSRLTREKVSNGNGEVTYDNIFILDSVGNRKKQIHATSDGSATIIYTYDSRDRLLAQTQEPGGFTTTYDWDANGNQVKKSGPQGITTYGWDAENRLALIELPNATLVENFYDHNGIRIATAATSGSGEMITTSDFVTDTADSLSQVVAEVGSDTGAIYIRGERLLGLVRNDLYYTHADHLGSVRALTTPSGTVAENYTYEAFGKPMHVGGEVNPFLFAGEQRDNRTGLVYLRARWMDPELGEFLGIDPWEGESKRPISLHPYIYAGCNPTNLVDPTGRFFASSGLANLAISSAISGIISGTVTFAQTRDYHKSLASALGGVVLGFAAGAVLIRIGGLLGVLATYLDDAFVPAGKVTYLLINAADRAKGFKQLGYTISNSRVFIRMLQSSRMFIRPENLQKTNQYGTFHRLSMRILGANGRAGWVDVVWQLEPGTTTWKLVTAIARPFV